MRGVGRRLANAFETTASSLLGVSCRECRQLHVTAAPFLAEYQLNTVRAQNFYDSTVEKYAAQEVEVLSLRQMLSFGRDALDSPEKILKSARYVQRELPKRLARRLLDLQLLPQGAMFRYKSVTTRGRRLPKSLVWRPPSYIVVTNPHIKKVYNQYYVSFETMRRVPPVRTMEDNAEWCQILRQHLDQHAPMLDNLATGLRECKSKELVGGCLQMDSFFDSMLRSRISRRVIAEQHLHLGNKRPAYIGTICTDLDVRESIEFAVQKTRQVCMETYGTAPDVLVSGDPKLTIPYIPAHLDYMLYELLKNAMRAVVEHHRYGATTGATAPQPQPQPHAQRPGTAGSPARLPPIAVRVCGGSGGILTIKVSDQGGGIPDDMIHKVWSYGFTTIGQPLVQTAAAAPGAAGGTNGGGDVVEGLGSTDQNAASGAAGGPGGGAAAAGGLSALMRSGGSRYQMAGLGFGLPLSRVYARYFGGDLRLQSIPGYGVDAYLQLRRLEEHEWAWQEHVDAPAALPITTPY